ncbi:ABC transporter-like [Arabidopsis suecica]|uniref:ABC transporter-like n=1 Tax=Arabidopsis suecica TaxID=45249 RepID=A0A8T2FNA3_ARASU|nr:ABC transporter-like [Arabidopsis suecica]
MGKEDEKESGRDKMKSFGSIRSIFMHADGVDWILMALGLIGAVGDGFITPVVVFIFNTLLNNLGTSSSNNKTFMQTISKNVVALLYVACGSWVICFLEGYCWTRTGERQAARMREKYLRAVLRQDVGYFDLHVTSTSDVITSISSDSLVIQDFLSEKLPNFLMNASAFVASYIVSFILMWRLTIVGFPFIILLLVPGLMYGRALVSISRKIHEQYNEAGSIAEQAISSVRTVYAFGSENKMIGKFSTALRGSVKLGLRQGLAKGITIGSNGVTHAIWAFLTWYGSRLVMNHGSKGGTVFVVISCITYGGVSLGQSLSNLKYFSEAFVAWERILEVIKRVPDIDSNKKEGQILERMKGEVEFNHVKFTYLSRPETTIFDDLCLKIPAGKTVALVGGSGSGKSTVISLLQRFYDPIAGEILIDGVSIDKLQVNWLRSQMGLVSQEPVLFATSITENILFGKEDASLDEVVEAAKASNAHTFISQFPLGYKTQVGERGVQMSGGQKQRIAIARAIIKSPKILLLDEATSALDSESERVVQESLDNASIGRTTIVIAHRLSTIRNADVICVIHNGQIVETGSHEELLKRIDGQYTSLVSLQQMENEESNVNINVSVTKDQVMSLSKDFKYSQHNSIGSTSSSIVTNVSDLIPNDNQPLVPSFTRLMAMNRPEWKHALYGCLSAALVGVLQPVSAYSAGSVISVFFLTSHDQIKEKTRIYVLLFVGLAIFSFLVNISQHYGFAYMGEYLTKRIREQMLSKILTFEVNWFDIDDNSSGAICSRLAKDANVVRSMVGDRMSLLVQTISAVIIACIIGLVIAWRLAIVMISVQPLIVVCFYTQRVLLKSLSEKASKAQDESSKLAAEAVSNIRTITAFSSQERIIKLLKKVQEGPRRESVHRSWLAGIVLGTSRSLITCTSALNFWYGGRLIADGKIVSKAFFEIFLIFVTTGRVIADAGTMTTDLARGLDAVGSVFAVLDRCTTIEPKNPDGYVAEKIKGQITFLNVDFAYPTRPDVVIFENFSIEIDEGKSTAIVGTSGSGKSTIIGLIERFYDPLKGTVKIDGRDIRSYHLRSLRKYISLVSQEPMLFAGTIRENIMYGGTSDKIDESEIIEAAKAANAHDFITSLSNGYDTNCGDKGVQLSGGQKQRIAIARAVLKNPSVLLLDEATSALDSKSERVVQDALERVMVGRTSIMIAHRLSTIQNCDMIVVLGKGKIVESGTHSSLLEKGPTGTYFSLAGIQRTLC